MSERKSLKTDTLTAEELADFLGTGDEGKRRGAEAEFRLREHHALLRQAESAERAAIAAERAATAAGKGADATTSYTKYTFWILVAALITAVAAVLGLFRS